MRRILILTLFLFVILLICGCAKKDINDNIAQPSTNAQLGTVDNPIKMAMVPSLDTQKLVKSGKVLSELLEKETGLKFEVSVPNDYKAVVMALGAGKIDIGWLSSLPYVLANDQYGVEAILTTIRDNSTKYWSFIIARTDSQINKLEDLKGKKFAFGDPISTSGCLYAKDLLRKSGFDPDTFFSQVVYAGGHDKVVMAVYNGQVDAGAIYGGVVSDAREKVLKALPDVMKKTKVIAKSVEIPNDTVSVRKDLPDDIKQKITDALLKIAASDDGKSAILDLYGIDGFVKAKDSDYDSVRRVAQNEKIELSQFNK